MWDTSAYDMDVYDWHFKVQLPINISFSFLFSLLERKSKIS